MKQLFMGMAAAWILAAPAMAKTPVDAEQQSSMFKRIFSYDKSLRDSDKIVVLVVAADPSDGTVKDIEKVFKKSGLQPAVMPVSSLNDELASTLSPESTVVYVVEGIDYASVKDFAAAKGFLTISGMPSLAMLGHVSVSVDLVGTRPEVVVNIPRLETEGHELSSELLKLARVVR